MSSIYSSFSENMNETSGTDAEAAYDIWLNNWGERGDDPERFLCSPARCATIASTATFGGSGGVPVQNWNLCQFGSELIWQLAGRNEQSGSVDILAMLTWLVSHGYLPQRSGLTGISYGFEICSTGGRPETFTLSQFSISGDIGQGRAPGLSGSACLPGRRRQLKSQRHEADLGKPHGKTMDDD